MSAWLAPAFATAAGVLALAGAAKLRSPRPTVQALEAVGVRVGAPAVRGLGLAELALGALCLLEPSPAAAAALCLAYATFASFLVALARAASGGVECGCFGSGSFTTGRGHVALNLVGATIALAATIWVPAPLLAIGGPLVAITVLAATAAATYLSYLAFTVLPGAWAAYGER